MTGRAIGGTSAPQSLTLTIGVSNGAEILKSHVAQSCYSVIGDKPFLWSKVKFDPL